MHRAKRDWALWRRKWKVRYWRTRGRVKQGATAYKNRVGSGTLDVAGLALLTVSAFRVPAVGGWLGYLVAGCGCFVLRVLLG